MYDNIFKIWYTLVSKTNIETYGYFVLTLMEMIETTI